MIKLLFCWSVHKRNLVELLKVSPDSDVSNSWMVSAVQMP